MNNSLQDYVLVNLLPQSLKGDPFVVALTEAVEKELKEAYRKAETLANLHDVDNLPEPVLDYLLTQWHVTYDEGAGLATTIEEKRRLVKNAFKLHRIKGTKRALEMVLEMLDIRGVIKEWFEYGGDPHHFRIEIMEITTRGLSDDVLNLLDRLIEQYKRKSACLESIRIFLTGNAAMRLSSAVLSGEEITVYPWKQGEIETKGYARFGSASVTVETIMVYPEVRE